MTRIASRVDTGGPEFRDNAAHMEALVAGLKRRQALAAAGGGEDRPDIPGCAGNV